MFKGATIFFLVFVFIAPTSRTFVFKLAGQMSDNLDAWAPMSYVFLGVLVAAFLLSIIIVKTWPTRAEPRNPMAKYKKEVRYEE
jgi:hypothetical protein